MLNLVLMPPTGSDPADEWHRLGWQAQLKGDLPEAQKAYNQALRLDPRHTASLQNLAVVFHQSNIQNEALLTIERAAMLDGETPTIHMNRAISALLAERLDEALPAARKAVALSPKGAEGNPARFVLASILPAAGLAHEAVPVLNEILDSEPQHPAAGVNCCFVQTLTDCGPEQLLKQRRRWYDANRFTGEKKPHDNDRTPDRRIRVGYVGGDFKRHSASMIFSAVLLHHTPAVEMFLYGTLPVDPAADDYSKKFVNAVAPDRGRDLSNCTDEQAEDQIRLDKIDILVDLAGHTNGGRLALFTRMPAPVQVTAWGFAHGTGLPEMDYFLADKVAVPVAERLHFAEKVIDLPCIITYEPPDDYQLKGVSRAPYKANDVFTFGCCTRYEKLSDAALRCFGEILNHVPDSRIEFKDAAFRRPYSIRRVMSFMPGVAPERVLFATATEHRDNLLSYQAYDLFLNPFPHSSGTVCLEVPWMGVPFLTLYGTQPAGRSGAAVLTAMGRKDWIAYSPEEYIAKAVEWAGRRKELAEARRTLRQELLESPVCKGYVEAVEEKYRWMWERWCKK